MIHFNSLKEINKIYMRDSNQMATILKINQVYDYSLFRTFRLIDVFRLLDARSYTTLKFNFLC